MVPGRRALESSLPQRDMTADLTQLFEQYYESLVRMLYRRTGDRDRAEDLAQETFARAVAAHPTTRVPGSLPSRSIWCARMGAGRCVRDAV